MEKFGSKGGRSGLPQDVIVKDFPKCDYVSGDLDDTMKGVDLSKDSSVKKAKKHLSNQK